MTNTKPNRYEIEQIKEIYAWMEEEPDILQELDKFIGDNISDLFNSMFEKLPKNMKDKIPAKLKKEIGKAINKALEKGYTGIDKSADFVTYENRILKKAKIGDIAELRSRNLKVSDKLAESVQNYFVNSAMVEGGATGLWGFKGLFADIPAFTFLQYLSIYQIGLCYGYKSTDKEFKAIQLEILNITSSSDGSSKRLAVKELDEILKVLNEKTWEEILKAATKESLSTEAVIVGSQKAINRLIETIGTKETEIIVSESGKKIIPLLSAILSAIINRWILKRLCREARKVFQKKWLMDNGRWIEKELLP